MVGDKRKEAGRTKVSALLEEGHVYSRSQLRSLLKTSDSTINTGVFSPHGYDSVMLFVTEEKGRHSTSYYDHLDGDVLEWDGQLSKRTDSKIIWHSSYGVELLVFYRRSKREFPASAFRYVGRFVYVAHVDGSPTHFVLRRLDSLARLP